jgi:hypothetical protein
VVQSDNAAEPYAARTVLAVTFLHQFNEPGVYYFHSIMSLEIHLKVIVGINPSATLEKQLLSMIGKLIYRLSCTAK